jgi:serine/threonine protein kinase
VDGPTPGQAWVIGRYVLCDEIAAGGMATVHFGRLLGPVGFARTVAIKRLHPTFAKDPEFVSMFLDEARIAARVRHPNVVPTLDIVALKGELFLVMEYVQGESLARLNRVLREKKEAAPVKVGVAILSGVLQGLHAAHEALSEDGAPLEIVHRDVSPQNVLVGADGIARVVDFGVAKAVGRLQTTREGQVKGKVAYMAPEQIRGGGVDRRADVYAASVVLWETLTGKRLFQGDNAMETMTQVLEKKVEPPSAFAEGIPAALDAVVLKGLEARPDARYATAREMALALEAVLTPTTSQQVGDWVQAIAGAKLKERAELVAEIERSGTPDATSLPVSLAPGAAAGSRGRAARATSASSIEATDPEPHDSTVTDLGLASRTDNEALPRKTRRRGPLVAAAVAVAFAGLAAVGLSRSTNEPSSASNAAPSLPAANGKPTSAQSAGPAGPASGPAALSSATTVAVPLSVQPAQGPAPPSVAVLPTQPAAHTPLVSGAAPAKRAPQAKPPSRGANASCDPPFTLDPTGLHVAKPECL